MSVVLDRETPALVHPSTGRGRALVPVLVHVGLLVAVVSSLCSPLVPTIAHDHGVCLATAQWSLTLTLLVGAHRDQRGPRPPRPRPGAFDPRSCRSCRSPASGATSCGRRCRWSTCD